MTESQDGDLISDRAFEAIQNLIVTGQLRGGTMISENELRSQLDCGRTPIREALQRLQQLGFVEIHPRRGVMVTTIDIRQQLELLEVRRPLEITMVRLAAARANPEQRMHMRKLADELETAVRQDDRGRYFGINRSMHDIEAQATQNAMLARTIGQIHLVSRRFWYSFIVASEDFAEAARLHCAVLRAIAADQAEDAADNAGQLLDYLDQITRMTIDGFHR